MFCDKVGLKVFAFLVTQKKPALAAAIWAQVPQHQIPHHVPIKRRLESLERRLYLACKFWGNLTPNLNTHTAQLLAPRTSK